MEITLDDIRQKQIWIVDFGSQYTQLITRKTRELGYSSCLVTLEQAKELFGEGDRPGCLILSGASICF